MERETKKLNKRAKRNKLRRGSKYDNWLEKNATPIRRFKFNIQVGIVASDTEMAMLKMENFLKELVAKDYLHHKFRTNISPPEEWTFKQNFKLSEYKSEEE